MMARSSCGPPKLRRTTSPDCSDDCGGESVCTKKKDHNAGEDTCKHFPVCGLVEGKNSSEIGEGDKVFQQHVDK